MKPTENKDKKLSITEQLGYYFGDLAGSMVNLYISAFFLTFCTYVLGISPAWMAGLIFVAKIWDAINDPLIGSLPDRFILGKSGDKFKPYIKLFMLPLALSCLLCFADTSDFPELLKHIWVAVGYIFYGMSYTGTSMPYGAMASVMTTDSIERTKLSRARSFGGMSVGILFMPLVSLAIWDAQGNPNAAGYFFMAIVAAVVCLIFYMLLLRFPHERIRPAKKEKVESYHFLGVFREALTNPPLVGVMVASIGSMFASAQSVSSYLYKEYYHMPRAQAMGSLISLPVMFLSFWLVPKLSRVLGKRKYLLLTAVYSVFAYLVLLIFPIKNPYVFMVANTIAGFGNTSFIMLVWALVTDSIDYQEYKTGKRSDGTLYAIYTFSRKIGSAASASIITAMISAIGFVAGAKAQNPSFGQNVRILMMCMPMLGAAIELIGLGLIYQLGQKETDEMYMILKERRMEKN